MIAITKSGVSLVFTEDSGAVQYMPTPTFEYKIGGSGQFDAIIFRSGEQLKAVNVTLISTIGGVAPGGTPTLIMAQISGVLAASGLGTPGTLTSSGHIVALTSTVLGTTFVPFASRACSQLTIVNDTGTDIQVDQDTANVLLTVLNGMALTFRGIANANQLSVCRKDRTTAQVTVRARWEL